LTAARALLAPSLVPETGSLVAMEALACGTPVIAFRAGALASVVEHGVTGYLVADAAEMGEAMHAAAELDPERCRVAARARFSVGRMRDEYLAIYHRLSRGAADTTLEPFSAVDPLHTASRFPADRAA
jgi:glycosyltransferase involved in cell wall biosynthesis